MFILNNGETEKIDDFLNKKGFQISKVKERDISKINDCGSIEWEYKGKVEGIDGLNEFQTIEKNCSNGKKITTYSSYNSQNYQKIKNEIIELGFKKIGENYKGERLNVFYRKGNYVIIFFKTIYDRPQLGIKKNSYQIMLSFVI